MSTAGYVIPIDPMRLATRFSSEDDAFFADDTGDSVDADSIEGVSTEDLEAFFATSSYEEKIMPLLDRIPGREADLILLYYILRKKQADIAAIFEVTQAAVSYRLARGIKRLKFLLSIPQVTEEDMRTDLSSLFSSRDVNILVGMWQTTCQSEVALRLSIPQSGVRHYFFRAVDRLKGAAEEDSKYVPYEKIFSTIAAKNFNILRAVSLPQWANRGGNVCE